MHRIGTCSLLFLAAAGLSQEANAADAGFDVEMALFGGYRFGGEFDVEQSDDSYKLDDSSSFGVILSLPHGDNTRYEVFYSRQDTRAAYSGANAGVSDADLNLHVLQVGGTYLGEGETVRPYLAATIGGTHVKSRSTGTQSDTFFSGSLGVGLLFQPDARLGLRLEARAHGTLMSSSTNLFCQTGPDQSLCAVRIEGSLLSQVETFAGIVLRF